MRFLTFLKQLPKSIDPEVNIFVKWVKSQKKIPLSSDPRAMGLYLANKLNAEQTRGYQKAILLYSQHENNMLSKDLHNKQALIDAVNTIIYYQDNPIV